MIKQIMIIMKKFILFILLMVSTTNVICQNTDSIVVVTTYDLVSSYPLTSDKSIERLKKEGFDRCLIYPLLILNNIIIRDEEKVNYFRNHYEFNRIRTKHISKKEAEKKGIPKVPKDGVLFVTTKKGYYFDLFCE